MEESYFITLDENLNRLDEFSRYEEDWNGYEAQPFSQQLIDKCKEIVNNLTFQFEIFPTGRNTIQFEYDKDNGSYLEFEVYEDKIKSFEILHREEFGYEQYYEIEIKVDEIDFMKHAIEMFISSDNTQFSTIDAFMHRYLI